jgi:AhpD family alkylhydroperoxidase
LFALAIAVRKGCDGCIASHARGVVRTGATESEVAEALGVALAVHGGPASVYGPPRPWPSGSSRQQPPSGSDEPAVVSSRPQPCAYMTCRPSDTQTRGSRVVAPAVTVEAVVGSDP